ncbi:MAG: hypothetical protein OS112_05170 [Methanoregula sp.]|nr:MAG: hypothetical protein OS112_05170 [Methanoregula sp.]
MSTPKISTLTQEQIEKQRKKNRDYQREYRKRPEVLRKRREYMRERNRRLKKIPPERYRKPRLAYKTDFRDFLEKDQTDEHIDFYPKRDPNTKLEDRPA